MGVRQVVRDVLLGCRGARSGVTPPADAGRASVDVPGLGTSSVVVITQVSGLRAGETFVVAHSVVGDGSIGLSEPDGFATGRVLADSADLGVGGDAVVGDRSSPPGPVADAGVAASEVELTDAASAGSDGARSRTIGMRVAVRSVLAGGRAVGKSLTVTLKLRSRR